MNWNPGVPSCPVVPSSSDGQITLAHGEGGRLTRCLIRERVLTRFGNEFLLSLGDSALLPDISGPFAFTTDSFVVSPLFFPGGDIGSLAVFGTVNDLAVSGARPLWMSVSLILEEGFSIETLDRVLDSIAAATQRANVRIVTGDTKVVPRGMADGLFITTSGIGVLNSPSFPGPASLQPGDELVVSGPIGRHGVAILACREGLGFDPPPISDCGPLTSLVTVLREQSIPVRAIRDATRGGVASVLHEWAEQSHTTLCIDETHLPVTAEVRGVCELLGLDPLHLANEGTMVIAVAKGAAVDAVAALHSVAEGGGAAWIGEVRPRGIVPVTTRRTLGREQPLGEPLGAPLPRIC